ncbi:hypothetical protein [Flavobacterium sp.]|uniref:hypothetical protein n=2 Tax=Flavobacterium sp. TaxID=239 RepID=UPI0040480834
MKNVFFSLLILFSALSLAQNNNYSIESLKNSKNPENYLGEKLINVIDNNYSFLRDAKITEDEFIQIINSNSKKFSVSLSDAEKMTLETFFSKNIIDIENIIKFEETIISNQTSTTNLLISTAYLKWTLFYTNNYTSRTDFETCTNLCMRRKLNSLFYGNDASWTEIGLFVFNPGGATLGMYAGCAENCLKRK